VISQPPLSTIELIRACAESNESAAWEDFVSRFHRAIALSVIYTANQWSDVPRHVVDDLVQETYLKLCADKCRLLLAFAIQTPDGITAYLKATAANVVHDYFKARLAQKRGAGRVQQSLGDIDPSAGNQATGSPGAMEREVLMTQIDQCLQSCLPAADQERDRLIFWLHYQQGMSAKAIASLPGVGLTPKGVESAILRLTQLIRRQVVSLRQEQAARTDSTPKGFRPAESY
jgi:RNA polymerase sigma-70 factor (ECF subfamily)